jgi:hypothetical protein
MVDKPGNGSGKEENEEDDFDDAWVTIMEQLGIDPETLESRLQETEDEDPEGILITLRIKQSTAAAKKVINIPVPGPLPDMGILTKPETKKPKTSIKKDPDIEEQDKEQDGDSPEIETKPVAEQREKLKAEILKIVIEEAAQNIQNFKFTSIIINTSNPIIGREIKQQLDEICKNEDLVLKASEDYQKIEITKKEGVEFKDRKMDEKSYLRFHSLLTNFSYMVTII